MVGVRVGMGMFGVLGVSVHKRKEGLEVVEWQMFRLLMMEDVNSMRDMLVGRFEEVGYGAASLESVICGKRVS